jgi:hypothetical protein
MRYHKDVYWPENQKENLIALTYALNQKAWRYTAHCLDNIYLRVIDVEQMLYFIKNKLQLCAENVFEFYTDEKNNITRLCYRINFSKVYDIILVIDTEKTILTIYQNSAEDKHETLKKNLYAIS